MIVKLIKKKYIGLLFIILMSWEICLSQELMNVQDTINHFSIGVPVGWRYGVPIDKSVAFIALRQTLDDKDVPRENFNINIFQVLDKDIETSFNKYLQSIGSANGFKLILQGEKTINGRNYRYLLETHKNKVSNEDMTNYTFFTNNNGKVLVLTMVTISSNYDKYKDLFESVAFSLIF